MEESTSSLEDSPVDSEEKHVPFDALQQRTVDQHTHEDMHARTNGDADFQRLPLTHLKSHTSTRSHQSYTDGYQHTNEDEEKQSPADGAKQETVQKPDFEVSWDGDNDPMNPRSKSLANKWVITLITSSSSVCVTCASSMVTSTYTQLERDFGASREVCTLALSIFVVGLGLGPMFLAPLSEFYGRRPIYLGAFGMFLIWLIPCAVAQNIETLIVARFFNGLAGSAFLSVAGGTVGDMFLKSQLSLPMMIFTASPFLGPELGPVVAGFINQYTDWRWTFYVLLIWSGVQMALIIFLVPETYHPVLLKRKAIRLRQETGNEAWYAPIERMDKSVLKTVLWSCIRPFQLLVYEPMCLCLCLLSAILLGILYLFFGAFPLVFENNYGFTESQVGLAFLGIMIGLFIGVSCDPLWKRNYARLVRNNGGQSEPEFRLPPTILGAIIVPIGLFVGSKNCNSERTTLTFDDTGFCVDDVSLGKTCSDTSKSVHVRLTHAV